jgi:glycosyltransferase involved in cell wall biosynthesis
MHMSLRIAHVTATFPPYCGGTGNVCYHNARELARRGHAVHVFTASVPGAPDYEYSDGITVQRLRPLLQVGNAPVLPCLVRVLRGFDLIHLHYPFYGGEITALSAKLCHIPLVITYHQDVLLDGLMGLIERILRRTIGRVTLRSAQQLLFTSLDYGRTSYALAMLGGRENIIGELPNGVDTTIFNVTNSPANLRVRHQLALDDRIALLVARLDRAHYFKGVDIFLQTLAQLPANVNGVVVGDGDLRVTYEAIAAQLGIMARVRFAGRVPDEELPHYYQLADVTVLPSTTRGEAFGLVLVESMASGIPVIATALPGVRTVVNHGSDGLLVKPGDPDSLAAALRWMLDDDAARQAMGRRGRAKVVAYYSWDRIGERLEGIYQQVLDSDRMPAPLSLGGEQ